MSVLTPARQLPLAHPRVRRRHPRGRGRPLGRAVAGGRPLGPRAAARRRPAQRRRPLPLLAHGGDRRRPRHPPAPVPRRDRELGPRLQHRLGRAHRERVQRRGGPHRRPAPLEPPRARWSPTATSTSTTTRRVDDLVAWARERRTCRSSASTTCPGSVPLETYDLPRECVLLLGQEGPGLYAADARGVRRRAAHRAVRLDPLDQRRGGRGHRDARVGPPARLRPARVAVDLLESRSAACVAVVRSHPPTGRRRREGRSDRPCRARRPPPAHGPRRAPSWASRHRPPGPRSRGPSPSSPSTGGFYRRGTTRRPARCRILGDGDALGSAAGVRRPSGRCSAAEEHEKGMRSHEQFHRDLAAGATGSSAAAPLTPSAQALSMRPDGPGGVLVTDGPFTESVEQVVGFYLVETDDRADLVRICGEFARRGELIEFRDMVGRRRARPRRRRHREALRRPDRLPAVGLVVGDAGGAPVVLRRPRRLPAVRRRARGAPGQRGAGRRPTRRRRVRRADGSRTVTDGPFAELAEQVGGYYDVELPDLDAAIAAARLLPPAYTVEIRPVDQDRGVRPAVTPDEALAATVREEWGRLVALLLAQFRRLDLVEDALARRRGGGARAPGRATASRSGPPRGC